MCCVIGSSGTERDVRMPSCGNEGRNFESEPRRDDVKLPHFSRSQIWNVECESMSLLLTSYIAWFNHCSFYNY